MSDTNRDDVDRAAYLVGRGVDELGAEGRRRVGSIRDRGKQLESLVSHDGERDPGREREDVHRLCRAGRVASRAHIWGLHDGDAAEGDGVDGEDGEDCDDDDDSPATSDRARRCSRPSDGDVFS